MTTSSQPTPFWLRIIFLLTGQTEKIVLDYDAGENYHEFSNKTKDEYK